MSATLINFKDRAIIGDRRKGAGLTHIQLSALKFVGVHSASVCQKSAGRSTGASGWARPARV